MFKINEKQVSLGLKPLRFVSYRRTSHSGRGGSPDHFMLKTFISTLSSGQQFKTYSRFHSVSYGNVMIVFEDSVSSTKRIMFYANGSLLEVKCVLNE
jgi:hypothetical protein